jgi:hypothetical protein
MPFRLKAKLWLSFDRWLKLIVSFYKFNDYLVAHESYHHGEIGIILTLSGQPLDMKTAFGMWEWGIR